MLVDDILTTGASLVETADAVREAGVEPLAAAVIVDRSTSRLSLAFRSIRYRIEIPSWPPESCELCRDVVRLEHPGSSPP